MYKVAFKKASVTTRSLGMGLLGCLLVAALLISSTVNANPSQYSLPGGEVLNDPTKPAGWNQKKAKGKKAKHFKLNYILSSQGRKQAIVNGKKVTEGSVISGARVIKIDESSVVLNVDGHKRVLYVGKGNKSIKQNKS